MDQELTEERIRFVAREHGRLVRKLGRMPGGRTMLPIDRTPTAGETILDVAVGNMAPDVRTVFDAQQALSAEYNRIVQLFVYAVGTEGMEMRPPPVGIHPPPTEAELRAVLNAAEEVAKSMPLLKRLWASAKKRRG